MYPCTPIPLTSAASEPIVPTFSSNIRFLDPAPDSDEFSKTKYDFLSNSKEKPRSAHEETFPEVWTKDGGLRGFRMETLSGKQFYAFQNIPFAQAPVGPLRFRVRT